MYHIQEATILSWKHCCVNNKWYIINNKSFDVYFWQPFYSVMIVLTMNQVKFNLEGEKHRWMDCWINCYLLFIWKKVSRHLISLIYLCRRSVLWILASECFLGLRFEKMRLFCVVSNHIFWPAPTVFAISGNVSIFPQFLCVKPAAKSKIFASNNSQKLLCFSKQIIKGKDRQTPEFGRSTHFSSNNRQ